MTTEIKTIKPETTIKNIILQSIKSYFEKMLVGYIQPDMPEYVWLDLSKQFVVKWKPQTRFQSGMFMVYSFHPGCKGVWDALRTNSGGVGSPKFDSYRTENLDKSGMDVQAFYNYLTIEKAA